MAYYNERMHMYQKHILDLLRGAASLRYSELQPEGVESSHFKYHLDQLQQDGLVRRIDRGVYGLTEKGKAAVDRLSVGRITPMQTPKVITYTLLKDDTYYYLFRKNKEPFLGTLNMVAGKVHLDERSYDAAFREVDEKTGLTLDALTQKLVAEVRIHENDQLVSHFVAYVSVATFVGEPTQLERYLPAEIIGRADLAPDFLALLEAIESGSPTADLNIHM